MPSPQELDSMPVGVVIPAIDMMFDETRKLRPELIAIAYDYALSRAQVICDQPLADDDHYRTTWGIVAQSSPRPYVTADGQSVELTFCMIKTPAGSVTEETGTNEAIGLLVRADEFESGPVMRLSRLGLNVNPATTMDTSRRQDLPEDLNSFFSAMQLFDGQGVLPVQTV